MGALLGVAGKAVEVAFFVSAVLGAVEALEEATVEEGHVGEEGEGGVGAVGEEALVAVEVIDVVRGLVLHETLVLGEGTVGLALAVFAHALVESGEEEVLQDGLVVGGAGLALGIEALEELGEVGGVEELFRDQVLFLEEPAEDEAGEQADEAGGAAFLGIGFEVGGELDLGERPEIPVGEFAVEAGVEQLDVENLLPGGVQGIEVGNRLFLGVLQLGGGEGDEDVEVAAVRGGEGDVADEGDAAEHVLGLVELVGPAVEDGEGDEVAVLDEHHDGRGEEAVELASEAGEFAARVFALFELDGEEDIGAKLTGGDRGVGEVRGLAAEFLVGELEKEIGSDPIGEECFGLIEERGGTGAGVFREEVEEGARGGLGDDYRALADVAKSLEETERGLAQWLRGEGG